MSGIIARDAEEQAKLLFLRRFLLQPHTDIKVITDLSKASAFTL